MQPYFTAYVRASGPAEPGREGNLAYLTWIAARWDEWGSMRGRKRTGAGFVPALTEDERADFGAWLDAVTS